jgi:hypothetical protein
MRAKEFITEQKKRGKMTKRQKQATVGVDLFRDPDGYDRTYDGSCMCGWIRELNTN